jgi:peptidase M15-like protein
MSTHAAAQPGKRVEKLYKKPWGLRAMWSPALRRFLDGQGRVTPNFAWSEFACHDAARTPVPAELRRNTIRLCWLLERMRHRLGDVEMTIDSGFRTKEHNTAVHGASGSRHMSGDAADFFVAQVDGWIEQGPARNRADVLAIADRIFSKGGLGNETSGTLHVDARGWRARFVTWTAAT